MTSGRVSSQYIVVQASDQAMGARTGLGAAMSCSAFEGGGTLLRETTSTGWPKRSRFGLDSGASFQADGLRDIAGILGRLEDLVDDAAVVG